MHEFIQFLSINSSKPVFDYNCRRFENEKVSGKMVAFVVSTKVQGQDL